ncbi:MAG: hypothetical protein HXY40_17735 [Chloroflexi bacterium]|nr:hypothetical protein [Chloroflexota bacterium]
MPNPFSALRDTLLQRLWYVHPAVLLTVQATPGACLYALAIAARPSVERLQLRDVFSDGRRYFLEARADGFRMRTNSSVRWRYRRRTGTITVLNGTFDSLGENGAHLHLRARIALPYLIDVFGWPLLFSAIFLPFELWPIVVRVGLALLLLGLSWVGHRAHARLQAVEMMYFIGRALEEFAPATIHALDATTPLVHDDTQANLRREFRREWEKFYQQHEGD